MTKRAEEPAPRGSAERAVPGDVDEIFRIIEEFAGKSLMLKRPVAEIYDHLRDFFVYRVDGAAVGISALHIWGSELGEIRSLAVKDDYIGLGIGKSLVAACMDEAWTIGLKKVFALTYVTGFFEKQGFSVVDKTVLPQKIWGDCSCCEKFRDCDETAVIREKNLHLTEGAP